MRKTLLVHLVLGVLALTACTQGAGPSPAPLTPAGPQTLTVMTHNSFDLSEDVLAAFERQHNARVQFLKAGDTGTGLNKAILAKNNPLADVFYGVDNTFLSRALGEEIFEPYAAPALAEIPAEFQLDPENRALPVDFGDVCLNYELRYFEEHALAPPQSLEDLLDPAYQGLLAVQNPATSSPGLAFLLATVGHFGPAGYLDFWRGLQANDLLVVNDWETAYYTEFSHWGGTRPIVVSYSSSPPLEVIFAEEQLETPPTAAVTGPGTCFRQVEFVGILKGTANRALAEKWVDFMLSIPFQEDMPLKMAVFPVNVQAVLDEEFAAYATIPDQPVMISPDEIAANRETWIQEWTETILR